MKGFWSKDTAKKPHKTHKSRERLTLDQALEQAVVKKARSDNEWALGKGLKKFGLEDEDTSEAQKKEIRAVIAAEALKQIKSNPDLLSRFTEQQIQELIGEVPSEGESSEVGSGSSIRQLIDEVQDLDELKDLLGAKSGGGWKDLLTPEVVISLLQTLASIKGGGSTPQPTRTKYVIRNDAGSTIELEEADYRRYLEDEKRKRLPAPKPKPIAHPAAVIGTITTPATETPPSVSISFLSEYLDKPPEEAILKLIEMAESGDQTANYMLEVMSQDDAEEIINMLQIFKGNKELGPIIEKLESQKEWLQQAIDYYRKMTQGDEGAEIPKPGPSPLDSGVANDPNAIVPLSR